MAANCTGEICRCYEVGIYYPNQTAAPPGLLIAALVHLYAVVVFGTLSNGLAIWCVATCTKTRAAVKVLLYSVFVPLLVICLVTRTMRTEMMFAVLYCDPQRTSKVFRMVTMLMYSFLAQMELACITVLAIVRAAAVWSHQKHEMSFKTALAIVISIFVYSFFTGVGLLGALWLEYVQQEHLQHVLSVVYFFVNTMLPFIVTAAAYAFMIIVVRINKRRLAAYQTASGVSGIMDQATRAMAALFISNLIFGFPHSLFHLFMKKTTSPIYELCFHMLFYTHFVVDPLVFIWFNNNYCQHVWTQACVCKQLIFKCFTVFSCVTFFKKTSSTVHPLKSSLTAVKENSNCSIDQRQSQMTNPVFTQSEV